MLDNKWKIMLIISCAKSNKKLNAWYDVDYLSQIKSTYNIKSNNM
jgi:hypothetical protein